MKYLTGFARIAVGLLFIFSGLIKLNDPMGFSFKLEEYFSTGVLDIPFLIPYALAISLVIVILEVVLGAFLLLGFLRDFTVWSLLLMILFFTFLTFYSAYFNKVTDCGCFGDAVKLTPWESFIKDVILLLLILILVIWRKHIRALFRPRAGTLIVVTTVLACILLANHVLNHLPVIDFRPYKVGNNIADGMRIPEDAAKPVFEYAWKFRVDGKEEIIVTHGDYPTVNGEFLGVETTEIQKGYEPPIHDFTIERNNEDVASAMLAEEKLVMVIAFDLAKSDYGAFDAVNRMAENAGKQGYKIIGMSASSEAYARRVTEEYQLNFGFYFTDATTLKTIVRSNPGVLVLNKGTISQKVHHNDLEDLVFD